LRIAQVEEQQTYSTCLIAGKTPLQAEKLATEVFETIFWGRLNLLIGIGGSTRLPSQGGILCAVSQLEHGVEDNPAYRSRIVEAYHSTIVAGLTPTWALRAAALAFDDAESSAASRRDLEVVSVGSSQSHSSQRSDSPAASRSNSPVRTQGEPDPEQNPVA
jgi:hypothetical protein